MVRVIDPDSLPEEKDPENSGPTPPITVPVESR
jgi:hypothetical protein